MSVRNALLALLEQRPRHAYELYVTLEALGGGKQNWDLKPAQVETTLSRLEEGGLVEVEARDEDDESEKRIYKITPAGREELRAWFECPVETEYQRGELYLKLMLSMASGAGDPQKVI